MPAATSSPSGCCVSALTASSAVPPKDVVTLPVPLKFVSGEREVGVGALIADASGDQLAIRLEHERVDPVVCANHGRHLAGPLEVRVERAVRVVAGERKVVVGAVGAAAGGDQLAVWLQDERVGVVVTRADRGRHLAGPVEVRVERAVWVVTGEREVVLEDVPALAGGDQLAVRLQHKRAGTVVVRAERGRDLAARAEARVERARGRLGGGNEQRREQAGGEQKLANPFPAGGLGLGHRSLLLLVVVHAPRLGAAWVVRHHPGARFTLGGPASDTSGGPGGPPLSCR